MPFFEPSFGDEINGHSFHDGSVVIILSEKLGELGFLAVENLSGGKFRGLNCNKPLNDRLYLLNAKKMVLVEILMIILDPVLYFKNLIKF